MTAGRRSMLVLLVLSGVIISLCMGLRQSLGLFMRPMTLELGISAATFGFSIALQNIVWGVSQPLVGALADRYGARPVLVGTALLYAAGLALMLFATSFPGALHVAGFLAASAQRAPASACCSARSRVLLRPRSAASASASSPPRAPSA